MSAAPAFAQSNGPENQPHGPEKVPQGIITEEDLKRRLGEIGEICGLPKDQVADIANPFLVDYQSPEDCVKDYLNLHPHSVRGI